MFARCVLVTHNSFHACIIISQQFCAEPTYPVLIEHLEKVSEWKLVAAHLLNDDDGSKTKEIERTYHGDVADCKAEMIRLFMKSGDISWQSVIASLRKAGYKNLADKIENSL